MMIWNTVYIFLKKKYDKFADKCYAEKMQKYFIANGINVDYDTLRIPSTVRIYAGSNFHMGGG